MLGAAALLVSNGTAHAQASKCTASLVAAAGKKADSLLKCHAKAESKGTLVDPACLGKAVSKFTGSYGKAIGKGDCIPGFPSNPALEAAIDAAVLDIVTELDPAYPLPSSPSKCSSGKKKAAGKKISSKAKCYQKARLKGLPVDSACLTAAQTKYSSSFAKAQSKADCLAPPGDAAAIEAKVDDLIALLNGLLVPSCGDGILAGAEVCDDGNNTNCDGCRGDCTRLDDVCGDGITECGEVCDDNNTNSCDGCIGDCSRLDDVCGDTITECGEACDDGNTQTCVPYPGCNPTCTATESCGDGIVNCGDVCDPPGSAYLTGICNGTCSGSPSGAFLN
jgi:cysteine-rich repeat protein